MFGPALAGFNRDPLQWNRKRRGQVGQDQDIEALSNNSNHSHHVNAVENDLVSVGNLENEVNLETKNKLRNTKNISYY